MNNNVPKKPRERRSAEVRRVPTFEPSKWTGPFVLPDIRNAIGLDSDEKVFLYTLASHVNFTEESAEDRILQRNGFGRHVFERVRKSLSALGLIEITYRKGFTNLYTLKVDALKRFPKAKSRSQKNNDTMGVPFGEGGGKSGGTPAGHRPKKLNRAALYTKTWPPSGLSAKQLQELNSRQTLTWRMQSDWAESDDANDADGFGGSTEE